MLIRSSLDSSFSGIFVCGPLFIWNPESKFHRQGIPNQSVELRIRDCHGAKSPFRNSKGSFKETHSMSDPFKDSGISTHPSTNPKLTLITTCLRTKCWIRGRLREEFSRFFKFTDSLYPIPHFNYSKRRCRYTKRALFLEEILRHERGILVLQTSDTTVHPYTKRRSVILAPPGIPLTQRWKGLCSSCFYLTS